MDRPLYLLYYLANLIALISCAYRWRFSKWQLRFQWIYLLINLVSEFVCVYLKSKKIDFLFVYNLVILIEYISVISLFSSEIISIKIKQIAKVSILVFALFSLYNIAFLQEYFAFNYSYNIRSLLFILIIGYYFIELYLNLNIKNVTNYPDFWIGTGFFIFCIGSFFVMGLNFVLSELDYELSNTLYRTIIPILNIYLYLSYFRASLCNQMEPI